MSGFRLSASYYGLPDTGFVAWPHVVDLTRRIRVLGGRSPAFGLSELQEAGISLAILSTPLLFAAQAAMERCLEQLSLNDMRLDAVETTVQLCETQQVLMANWKTSRTFTSPPHDGSQRSPRAVAAANSSDPARMLENQSEKTDEF